MNIKLIAAAAAVSFLPISASALTIDFTDPDAYDSFANTGATGSFNGYTWTATSENPTDELTRYDYDGDPGDTGGLDETYDGLGVKDDEITFAVPPELIHLEFSGTIGVDGFHFLDLFFEDLEEPTEEESVLVWFGGYDGGAADLEIFAIEAFQEAAGYLYYELPEIWYGTKLSFGAGRGNDLQGAPDYALAAINVVPLPAAGWLLLAGVGGLAAMRRRKKA